MFGLNEEFFVGLVILIIIFLLCREIFCWYCKQNEQVKLLKDIKALLEEQERSSVSGSTDNTEKSSTKNKPSPGTKDCKYCGQNNVLSNTHCIKCGNKI